MKATFSTHEPHILIEAALGEPFTPMGTELVECVCVLRSFKSATGDIQADIAAADRFNPDARVPVVVIACRVGKDEPEYYPAGYMALLTGATPIAFLEQVEALALREKFPPRARPECGHAPASDYADREFFGTAPGDYRKPRFFDATPDVRLKVRVDTKSCADAAKRIAEKLASRLAADDEAPKVVSDFTVTPNYVKPVTPTYPIRCKRNLTSSDFEEFAREAARSGV